MTELRKILDKSLVDKTAIERCIKTAYIHGEIYASPAADELACLIGIEKLAEEMAEQLRISDPNCAALTHYEMATGQA